MIESELTGWEQTARQIGYEGMTASEAGRTRHLTILPMWEANCTCGRELHHYSTSTLASEHLRCHQTDCDVHSGAVDRWKQTRRK